MTFFLAKKVNYRTYVPVPYLVTALCNTICYCCILLHQDVTSMYTVLSIAGPKSKELMDEMTGTDMSMHPFTYREVNVGYASGVMVLAVTNTGKRFEDFFFLLQL